MLFGSTGSNVILKRDTPCNSSSANLEWGNNPKSSGIFYLLKLYPQGKVWLLLFDPIANCHYALVYLDENKYK